MELVDYSTLITTIICALIIAIGGSLWGAVKLFARKIAIRDDQITSLLSKIELVENHINTLEQRNNKQDDTITNLTSGGLALLADRIKQSCYAFIRLGYTTYLAKENISIMFQNYCKFGNDPMVITIFNEYDKLPVHSSDIDVPHMPHLNNHKNDETIIIK